MNKRVSIVRGACILAFALTIGGAAPASVWLDCRAMAERVAAPESCCPHVMAADHSCCAGGAALVSPSVSLNAFDASCCTVHPGTDAPGVPEPVTISGVPFSGTPHHPTSVAPATNAGFVQIQDCGYLHGPPSIPILNSSLLC